MFGIGPMELVVIAIVAMLFIGPDKLPDLMRKFGKIFVQVRRQANEVKSGFNDVIHEAEREFELERIRELQKKLQSTSPQQVLDAALADSKTTATKPLQGPGLDEHGHPLPGYDENGYPLAPEGATAQEQPEYHEGHYVDGKFVKNADTFVSWDPAWDKPLNELFPLKQEEAPADGTAAIAAQPAVEAPAPAPSAAAAPAPEKLAENPEKKPETKPS
ncbi:MAG TPA: Sec-independent protein translocase protein TatB [Oligoflexus sp.]|uniref:Sec-independent protein translocase protein TatB n=1 Tax=Oligoflexus sp. TaxID=1971216 RepID=UPI002D809B2A|nr:Sec-independent protein translocase protein TatB [Oligoflexus sp.]HET9236916.1 Sec-independent protein translocase protein TatB [Oligoflexus sp.]